MELTGKFLGISDGVQWVDIAFDIYQPNTIKSVTRDSKVNFIRFSVNWCYCAKTRVP